MSRRLLLRARRWWYGRSNTQPPLNALMSARLCSASTAFEAAEFVSLDIETTGLEGATADMLSVGWVLIRQGRVHLASAESHIVRPVREVGASATVHGLTDTVVGAGRHWGDVLDRIVTVLTGRILVVHHAGLDKALLDRLSRQRYGAPLAVPVIDTLELEHRRRQRRHQTVPDGALRLADLRNEYGLPRYAAHDCLVDAIATAELLLAIRADRRVVRVGELV